MIQTDHALFVYDEDNSSDLIDELEKEIGIKIQNVDITPKVGLMNIRGVKFNIEL